MKIVCDSCGAKYSIADEKVRGKVFKIRCKKCGEVIVVRGDSGSQPGAEAARAAEPAVGAMSEAIWHLVVNGEQQGPFAAEQIGQMLSAGQIDWEAYAWRDGFEGWLHMREIDELVTAVTGQPAPQAPQPEAQTAAPAAAAAFDGMFGSASQPSGGIADLFGSMDGSLGAAAEPAPSAARSPVASSGRAKGGAADLFATGGAGEDDDIVASKPDMSGGAPASMTGARNENSVLFSLANLQALATKGQPATPASSSSPPGRTGFASGSGSGLIDIRALSDGAPPSAQSSGSAGIDDLLSIGGPSAFAPSLGAPVLMPARSEGGKLLYVLLAVAAVLVLGIIGLVVVILTREPTPQVASVVPPVVAAPQIAPAMPATLPSNGPAPVSGSEVAAPTTAEPAPGRDTEEPRGRGQTGQARAVRGERNGGQAGPSSGRGENTTPTKGAEVTPTKRSGSNNLDDLISGALNAAGGQTSGSSSRPAQPTPQKNIGPSGPSQPSRSDVQNALRAVQGAVRACAAGAGGTASIRITFAGSGRVTTATVSSPPFAGTPAGSCMARAVRSARVPPFSSPSLTVTFPFVVR